MIKFIKKSIRGLLFNPVKKCIFRFVFKSQINELRSKYESLIIIVATPEHGNLGDQAIVYAELQLINEAGLSNRILEISNGDYLRNKQFIKKYVTINDVIIIDGGGNLGTLWPWEDDKISEIIDAYSENTIVVFPQTCYYDSSEEAKNRIIKNVRIYNKAKRLTISLRDEKSYQFCKKELGNNTNFLLIPDIVLFLRGSYKKEVTNRQGVLLCFRKDHERATSEKDVEKLKIDLSKKGVKYSEISTLTKYGVNQTNRTSELEKKWTKFGSAELLLTDRLHGLIFAILTNTPCLAIDNLSKKVSGVYNIVEKVENVKICKDLQEVEVLVEQYRELSKFKMNKVSQKQYNELSKIIISSIQKSNGKN
jgi:pyruvyl transferase EpsI